MEESRTHFSALKGEGRICYDSSMMDRKREREGEREREGGRERERVILNMFTYLALAITLL